MRQHFFFERVTLRVILWATKANSVHLVVTFRRVNHLPHRNFTEGISFWPSFIPSEKVFI